MFRAKRKDTEQWVMGSLLDAEDRKYIVPDSLRLFYDEKEKMVRTFAFEVRPDTICRDTGMKDKNGKKIWEHDIVRAYEATSREWLTNEAVFEYGCFKLIKEQRCDSLLCGYMSKNIEIVGNVFDNPD